MQIIDSNIESNVQLPRQVREQADRARQMLKPEGDQPAVVTDPQQTAEPVVTPLAAPVSEPITSTDLLDPAPGKENDPAYWRHRASAINGFWKKDKERFAAQIDQLKTQVTTLSQELAKLQAAKPVSADDIDPLMFFTPEQVEDIGEQQCKVLARAAMVAAQKGAQTQVDAVVEPMRRKQEEDAASEKQQRFNEFLSELTKLVPTWQAINSDDRWLYWLAQQDEVSGMERQDLLDRAMARNDARRVAGMLNQFMDSLGVRADVPDAPPVLPAGNAGGTSGEDPRPAVTSFPTKAEIKAFYVRAAQSKVTDQERKEFDARVAAAQAAGYL